MGGTAGVVPDCDNARAGTTAAIAAANPILLIAFRRDNWRSLSESNLRCIITGFSSRAIVISDFRFALPNGHTYTPEVAPSEPNCTTSPREVLMIGIPDG